MNEEVRVKKCGICRLARFALSKAGGRRTAKTALLTSSFFLLPSLLPFSLLADAGSATASGLALSGGMSLIDGTFITAMFCGLTSVITAIGFIIHGNKREAKLREQIANELRAKIVNDPLNTHEVPSYVTCDQCAAHRASLSKRIDELGPALNRIFKKLTDIDYKSEQRAINLNRRMDPLVEKVAANAAKMELMESKK